MSIVCKIVSKFSLVKIICLDFRNDIFSSNEQQISKNEFILKNKVKDSYNYIIVFFRIGYKLEITEESYFTVIITLTNIISL